MKYPHKIKLHSLDWRDSTAIFERAGMTNLKLPVESTDRKESVLGNSRFKAVSKCQQFAESSIIMKQVEHPKSSMFWRSMTIGPPWSTILPGLANQPKVTQQSPSRKGVDLTREDSNGGYIMVYNQLSWVGNGGMSSQSRNVCFQFSWLWFPTCPNHVHVWHWIAWEGMNLALPIMNLWIDEALGGIANLETVPRQQVWERLPVRRWSQPIGGHSWVYLMITFLITHYYPILSQSLSEYIIGLFPRRATNRKQQRFSQPRWGTGSPWVTMGHQHQRHGVLGVCDFQKYVISSLTPIFNHMSSPTSTMVSEGAFYRRKFRSQTSDLWTDAAAVVRAVEEEKETEERVSRKKIEGRERIKKSKEKSRKHCVFPMFCGFGGSKSRLAKATGAEPSGKMRWDMKSCTPLWRDAHFEVKMHTTPQGRSTLGYWVVEKEQAVVAAYFQGKMLKYFRFQALLAVELFKKRTPWWLGTFRN